MLVGVDAYQENPRGALSSCASGLVADRAIHRHDDIRTLGNEVGGDVSSGREVTEDTEVCLVVAHERTGQRLWVPSEELDMGAVQSVVVEDPSREAGHVRGDHLDGDRAERRDRPRLCHARGQVPGLEGGLIRPELHAEDVRES